MSEFGHVGIIGGGFCIDTWGVGPHSIEAEGKTYRFEDSDRFGPALIKKNGDLKENPYPAEKSPFWRAHRIWVRQGRRTEDDGATCIWDEPRPHIIRKIGKRTAILIEAGDEDGEFIEEKKIIQNL